MFLERHILIRQSLQDATESAVRIKNGAIRFRRIPCTRNEAVVHHVGVHGGFEGFRLARQIAVNEQGDIIHIQIPVMVQVAVNPTLTL